MTIAMPLRNMRARARRLTPLAAAVCLLAACPSTRDQGSGAVAPNARAPAPVPGAPPAATAAAEPTQPVTASSSAPLDVGFADGGGGVRDGGDSLPVEEGERDPRSETVTIRLQVDPPQRARVFWGVKDLGAAPLEIKRPRGSGPLDLSLRAPGYLTFHTRVFTDRDDRLSVRLVPLAEASGVFGYRPSAPPKR